MLMIGKPVLREPISLYFHIPFCKSKCHYCHFYVLPEQEKAKDQLLRGFQAEWTLLRPLLEGKEIATLYFGGGTPSLFGPSRLASLLHLIQQGSSLADDVEITLEANPENVTLKEMQAYADIGVNRVSIGIQTLDAELLKLLGRLHSPDSALRAIQTTYEAGIHNISIDLMYDLPKQTLQHWAKTLENISQLPISHLSLYNLTIEPHTLFFKNRHGLKKWLPDEDTSLAMYEQAVKSLESYGLQQYEISAFARPGYASKHNTGYWIGRNFWGLGPSAFSYWQGKRFRHVAHLKRYCQILEEDQRFPIDFEEVLDPDAHRRELFVIHLRLRQGVCLDTFTKKYGALDPTIQATIQRLTDTGYLDQMNKKVSLTKRGILFYDTVASELI